MHADHLFRLRDRSGPCNRTAIEWLCGTFFVPSLHLNALTRLLCRSFAHFAGSMVRFHCFLLYLFFYRCFLAHPAGSSALDSALHLRPARVSSRTRQDDVISPNEDEDERHTVAMCRSYIFRQGHKKTLIPNSADPGHATSTSASIGVAC